MTDVYTFDPTSIAKVLIESPHPTRKTGKRSELTIAVGRLGPFVARRFEDGQPVELQLSDQHVAAGWRVLAFVQNGAAQ